MVLLLIYQKVNDIFMFLLTIKKIGVLKNFLISMNCFLKKLIEKLKRNTVQIVYCHQTLIFMVKKNPLKEITESMSAINYISDLYYSEFQEFNNICLVVADGKTPRTAILFATITNWKVHSIDPMMGTEWYKGDLKNILPNLFCHCDKIENIYQEILNKYEKID